MSVFHRPLALIFSFLMLSAAACSGGGDGGAADNGASGASGDIKKILDGIQISPADAPQILAINIEGIDTETGRLAGALCTGTVITRTKILTAAHCFKDFQLTSVTVSNGQQTFNAVRLWVHPSFTGTSLRGSDADLAILETSQTLPFPVLGIFQSHPLSPGEPVFVYGYGETNDGSYGDLYAGWMYLQQETKNSLYAEYIAGDTSEPCQGDSGGPLVGATFDDHGNTTAVGLIGITSYGSEDSCTDGDVTRFVNLRWSTAVNFIKSVAPDAIFY